AARHKEISPILAQGLDGVDRPTLYKLINEVLAMIWETALEPILSRLGIFPDELGTRHKRTRICWIPTGVLGLYPLHAAGPTPEDGEPVRCAADFVVSSYAPTLKLLVRARKVAGESPPRGLGVDPGRRERPVAGIIA